MILENKTTYIIIGGIAVIAFIIIAAVILLDDGSKKGEENVTTTAGNKATTNQTSNNTDNTNNNTTTEEKDNNFDYVAAAEKQMAEPVAGETIAVMHVKDYGDITFKFFEEKAPKAVENFLTHAKNGYYNGVKFHRVMEEFMIQGGDPKGNGTGGESIWGKGFEEEFDQGLVPYRGALCMASAGKGKSSLGSQFFIVQANPDEAQKSSLQRVYSQSFAEAYSKYGGYPSLYENYTVFGQVVSGMDIVDKIASVEKTTSATGEKSVPTTDIIIESIDVTTK